MLNLNGVGVGVVWLCVGDIVHGGVEMFSGEGRCGVNGLEGVANILVRVRMRMWMWMLVSVFVGI
jgi:hypothetical protein